MIESRPKIGATYLSYFAGPTELLELIVFDGYFFGIIEYPRIERIQFFDPSMVTAGRYCPLYA